MDVRGLKSFAGRVYHWAFYGILSLFILVVPILAVDYFFYKRFQLVPLNIVLYNVLNAGEGKGPDIYGVSRGLMKRD